jgi:hypothetical protein
MFLKVFIGTDGRERLRQVERWPVSIFLPTAKRRANNLLAGKLTNVGEFAATRAYHWLLHIYR